jgi:uncharacterized damage-inducible protein DinB
VSTDINRIDPPPRGNERELLEAFLDFHRQTLEWKCSGLTPEQLKAAASPPSPLTLLGLLRHCAEVEHYWFDFILLGSPDPVVYEGEDLWSDLDRHSVEEVVHRWEQACQTSRQNVSSLPSLDHPAGRPRHWDGETVTLRWIMIHAIEEYARHNGHADFLRERIDGATGE